MTDSPKSSVFHLQYDRVSPEVLKQREDLLGTTSAQRAAARIAAEMISPCPPGVPVIAPGEVITDEVLHHLRSGADHGVLIPDASDPSPRELRVVRRRAAGHHRTGVIRSRNPCLDRGRPGTRA
ncbi:hypothetical protein [Streptomyces sp. NPDC086519]|uniref:Orn/Lys/Arg family decarboxylase n=1 Tax=Streptomyces sp. NPDC086519 TaxID=3154863 RepID=UPI00343121F7